MKLEGNQGNNFEITTGVVDVSILAVNPTLEQLNELGLKFKKEPEYLTANPTNGNKRVRLDFIIKPSIKEMGVNKHTFFIEDAIRFNKDETKCQYINSYVQSTWADKDSPTFPEWFKNEGVRKAYVGEVTLMEFLKSFTAVEKLEFDNFPALFNNNMTELREVIKMKSSNKVQLLACENNGYQSFYTGFSMRGGNTRMDFWKKHLDRQADYLTINYQDSLQIKTWKNQEPSESAPDEPTAMLFS